MWNGKLIIVTVEDLRAVTMLTAVLSAQYERKNSAFNRKDIAFANARHAVRLTLK
jgi:hypothetical protein